MRVVTTTPSRRTVLRATAWTAPAVVVVAAAPAYAASAATTVTGTLGSTRSPNDVSATGTVTNNGTTPVMVTLVLTIETDPATSERTTSGSSNANGWARVDFRFLDANRGLRYTARRQIAGGQTVPAPLVAAGFAETAFGTSSMALTVPSPATATSPAPVPFTAYTGPAQRSAAPTGPTPDELLIER